MLDILVGLIGGFFATGAVHFPKQRKSKSKVFFCLGAVLAAAGMLYFGFQDDRPDVINANRSGTNSKGRNRRSL